MASKSKTTSIFVRDSHTILNFSRKCPTEATYSESTRTLKLRWHLDYATANVG